MEKRESLHTIKWEGIIVVIMENYMEFLQKLKIKLLARTSTGALAWDAGLTGISAGPSINTLMSHSTHFLLA